MPRYMFGMNPTCLWRRRGSPSGGAVAESGSTSASVGRRGEWTWRNSDRAVVGWIPGQQLVAPACWEADLSIPRPGVSFLTERLAAMLAGCHATAAADSMPFSQCIGDTPSLRTKARVSAGAAMPDLHGDVAGAVGLTSAGLGQIDPPRRQVVGRWLFPVTSRKWTAKQARTCRPGWPCRSTPHRARDRHVLPSAPSARRGSAGPTGRRPDQPPGRCSSAAGGSGGFPYIRLRGPGGLRAARRPRTAARGEAPGSSLSGISTMPGSESVIGWRRPRRTGWRRRRHRHRRDRRR